MRSRRASPLLGLAIALCALPVLAGHAETGAAARPARRQTVRVGIELESPAAAAGRYAPAMVAEADAIWRPYGVTAVLLNAGQPGDSPVCDARLSLTFGSAASAAQGGASSRGRTAPGLGSIWFHDGGVPARSISVDPGMVAATVTESGLSGRRLDRWPPALADQITARALGRVLAHELGHYLLASSMHALSGLMRPAFAGSLLAGWDRRPFALDATALPRLRARLARLDSLEEPFVAASDELP